MPIGGFSLAEALQDYNNVAQTGYNIRQRSRRIQDEDAADQNPLPGYMGLRQQFQQSMGPEYQMAPGSPEEEQLLNQATVRAPQGQRSLLQQRGQEVPPIVKQKRKMDLKAELAESMNKYATQKAKNATISASMDAPGSLMDPSTKKLMRDALKSQEMEILQAYQRSLRMGFQDIWNDPDVQDMVTQSMISGLLGPTGGGGTAMPPGGGGFQMPDTSIPNLTTGGLLGGMGPSAAPRNRLIETIDKRRGQ